MSKHECAYVRVERERERGRERERERAASLRAKDGFMDLCTCGWRDNYIAHCIYGIYGIILN